jgi:hypothetical protein
MAQGGCGRVAVEAILVRMIDVRKGNVLAEIAGEESFIKRERRRGKERVSHHKALYENVQDSRHSRPLGARLSVPGFHGCPSSRAAFYFTLASCRVGRQAQAKQAITKVRSSY